MANTSNIRKGQLYSENGKLFYDGEWENGLWDGNGKCFNEGGNVQYDGEFKNGERYCV